MNNKIYLSAIIVIATCFTSCEVDSEGTEPGGDSQPVATIYQIALPATDNSGKATDVDTDAMLRIVTNSATEHVYILGEALESRTERISSGADYAQYVVDNGVLIDGLGADASQDYLLRLTDMGQNVITVVATRGADKTMRTVDFTCATWTTLRSDNFKNADLGTWRNVELQQSDVDKNKYRLVNAFGTSVNLVFCIRTDNDGNTVSYGDGLEVDVEKTLTGMTYTDPADDKTKDIFVVGLEDEHSVFYTDDNSLELQLDVVNAEGEWLGYTSKFTFGK